MKRLLLFLLLAPMLASTAVGQSMFQLQPIVSSTTVDSIAHTTGSTSFELDDAAVGDFTGITAGMRVQGSMLPFGTTVSSNSGDTLLVLSNAATSTDTLGTLQFALKGDTTYADGEALGFTFRVPFNEIWSISVLDETKQMASVEAVFMSGYFYHADNTAFAPSDANADKIFNFRILDDLATFSSNVLITSDRADQPILNPSRGDKFIQLVATGADTLTTTTALTVTIIGK